MCRKVKMCSIDYMFKYVQCVMCYMFDNSFECMLAMKHYIENLNCIKSKKMYDVHMKSLMNLLCENYEYRMRFIELGGFVEVWVGGDGEIKRFDGEEVLE